MNTKIKVGHANKEMQHVLGAFLRIGVVVSILVMVTGGVVYLLNNADKKESFEVFNPQNTTYISLATIFNGLKTFNGLAIIQFGVLLLIFTPIARIFLAIYAFVVEKDYLYVVIGVLVLLIIFISLYLDIAH